MEILTYGCALNQSDSERLHAHIRKAGLEDEDFVIVNTCTVKTPTETKIRRKLDELKGRKVVVTGCIPAANPKIIDDYPEYSFIGVNTGDIVEAVKSTLSGKRIVLIEKNVEEGVTKSVRTNPITGIIQISAGCLGSCSYCQTKHARGHLKSKRTGYILQEAKEHIAEGAKEIWLTSQDTGAYGRDIGTTLPQLMNEISELEGEFMVRVGMMNPDHAHELIDELIKAFQKPKIYRFAHIPVQSGDDKVLKDMNRKYNIQQYRELVKKLQAIDVTISTDYIVGYPTEDEKAFQNSLKLIEELQPDIINVTRYWARPNTTAAKLKHLQGSTIKNRSRKMGEYFQRSGLIQNKRYIGWIGKALVTKINPDGTRNARNPMYKPIIVEGGEIGEWVDIKVTDATSIDLRGIIIN